MKEKSRKFRKRSKIYVWVNMEFFRKNDSKKNCENLKDICGK
jgi:hypothetical protein